MHAPAVPRRGGVLARRWGILGRRLDGPAPDQGQLARYRTPVRGRSRELVGQTPTPVEWRGTIESMTTLDTRLERLLVDDYLDGLTDRPLDELRAMRAECQRAETAVSFLRRLAQGRLDIIHAYLDRREDEGAVDMEDLVEELSEIMAAGPPRPIGPGRLPAQMAPAMDAGELAVELDQVIDAGQVVHLAGMSVEQLRAIADQLAVFEQRVSRQRRSLHERIDRLQAEIVSRYKAGVASADELLG